MTWAKYGAEFYDQLARELIRPIAELTKATSGIDFANHCEAMLRDGYDPREVADD